MLIKDVLIALVFYRGGSTIAIRYYLSSNNSFMKGWLACIGYTIVSNLLLLK